MIPRDLSKDIKTRLQGISGQLGGLIKMLDEDADPDKILIQFKAAQKGLDKAHFLLLDETYRKALAIKISETVVMKIGLNLYENDSLIWDSIRLPLK